MKKGRTAILVNQIMGGGAEIEGRYVYRFQKSLIIDKGKNKKKSN